MTKTKKPKPEMVKVDDAYKFTTKIAEFAEECGDYFGYKRGFKEGFSEALQKVDQTGDYCLFCGRKRIVDAPPFEVMSDQDKKDWKESGGEIGLLECECGNSVLELKEARRK